MNIFKYTLAARADVQTIGMPHDARIIAVAAQRDTIGVWAEVDPTSQMATRSFSVVKTGEERPPEEHLGTCLFHGGDFVLHVYGTRSYGPRS